VGRLTPEATSTTRRSVERAKRPLPDTGFAKARSGIGVPTMASETRNVAKPMLEERTACFLMISR
jgi:hypothetical protein